MFVLLILILGQNDSQVFSDYFFDFYQNQFFPYIIENSDDICGMYASRRLSRS